MSPTIITVEIPADAEPLVRQVLALRDELQSLALTAPDGTVLDACEAVVTPKGRDVSRQLLADAVARRIAATEKKGPRSAPASAGGPRRTGGPGLASS